MRGLFVTFEGTEGSGKSTQIQVLARRLRDLGKQVVTLREPGGTALGERVREILKSREHLVCSEAELLLMNASRAQLVREVIEPEVAAGKIVLCDRFFDSTVAYQVYGRQMDPDQAQRIIDFAIADTRPDLTLLLRIPLELSEARRSRRAAASGESTDRLEAESRSFFERVEKGYDAIAANTATRVRAIDGTKSPEHVHEEVWRWVEPILYSPPTQGEQAWKTIGEYRQEAPG